MKRLVYLGLIMLTGSAFNTFAQESDSTGMPGDNFDLQGALELFKQSKNLEDFEKKLNTESSGVNNLDLDGDNKIDYIRVVDKKDGDNHAILLQIPINKKETQDIAAIAIEKRSDKEAQLQIIGNEAIYGEETIMEPIQEQETKKSSGPAILAPTTVVFVNVWGWPCVQYIYDPFYDPWYSPYYWDYYPSWWNPWRPVYWHVYYQRMYPYQGWCHYTPYYHVPHAHALYASNHSNSSYVRKRYEPQRTAYKGRSVYNQSAGSNRKVETGGKAGTVNTREQKPAGGREGTVNPDSRRPATDKQPENQYQRTAPRPVDPNGRERINNENTNGNSRTVEPSRRNPNPSTQPQRTPERVTSPRNNPQRVQPQPQRQPQPTYRQTAPVRTAPARSPSTRPSNGGRR